MKGTRGLITIAAACLALTACTGTDPVDSRGPAGVPTGTGTASTGDEPTGGTDYGGSEDSTVTTDEPPDIPSGPIDYDNTRTGGGRSPKEVKEDMESQLADQCGRSRCGVKVVITGSGKCVDSVTPRPVQPGGRISVKARACIDGEVPSEEPEPESKSAGPGSGKASEAPAESGTGG